jgi:hypothetical protein
MARSYSIRQLYLSLQQYKINVNSTVVERNAANMSNRSGVLLTDRVLAEFEMTNGLKLLTILNSEYKYRVILSVLGPRKCEYLKDYSLDFEQAYMTTYLAS